MTYEQMILDLAKDRGRRGETFATVEEKAFDGYDNAWLAGRVEVLLNEAEAYLRFDGVPGIEINGEAQHRVNLAIYTLRELRRVLSLGEGV